VRRERSGGLFLALLLLVHLLAVWGPSAGRDGTGMRCYGEGKWDNLAADRPWYAGFARLMTNKELRRNVSYEQKGLYAMAQQVEWDHAREGILVRAVHGAISSNLAQIKEKTDGQRPASQATFNRWDRFKERLRLSLVGAKTPEQCRNALCTLFANAGYTHRNRINQSCCRNSGGKIRPFSLLRPAGTRFASAMPTRRQ